VAPADHWPAIRILILVVSNFLTGICNTLVPRENFPDGERDYSQDGIVPTNINYNGPNSKTAIFSNNPLQPKVFGVKFSLTEMGRFFPLKYAISSFGNCLNN